MDGYGSRDSESLKRFIYRFLQRVFSEPDDEFYNFLNKHEKELKDIGIEIDKGLDLQALQIEFTNLFLGPNGHFPPYESVFCEGRFWGTPASNVKKFLAKTGLEINKGFKMPPDHIAVEFEIIEKILESDAPHSDEYYREFLNDHISWIFDYLGEIISKTKLKFYQSSFAFSKVFLKEELTSNLFKT